MYDAPSATHTHSYTCTHSSTTSQAAARRMLCSRPTYLKPGMAGAHPNDMRPLGAPGSALLSTTTWLKSTPPQSMLSRCRRYLLFRSPPRELRGPAHAASYEPHTVCTAHARGFTPATALLRLGVRSSTGREAENTLTMDPPAWLARPMCAHGPVYRSPEVCGTQHQHPLRSERHAGRATTATVNVTH
jgi:hypothetical protein